MPATVRRAHRWVRVAMLAACALVLLSPASPASADDIYEIDGRLQDAGFDLAYTEAFDAADRPGVRVVVDFDSGSEDAAAYRREAEQAAELVWDHLDGRVLVVDVASTFDVAWAEGGLPAALSFDRAALTQRFGARPAELDAAEVSTADEGGLAVVGAVVAGWLLSLVVVGVATFFLTRASCRRLSTATPPGYPGGWAGPAVVPAGWPQQPAGVPVTPPLSPEQAGQQAGQQAAPSNPWQPLG